MAVPNRALRTEGREHLLGVEGAAALFAKEREQQPQKDEEPTFFS